MIRPYPLPFFFIISHLYTTHEKENLLYLDIWKEEHVNWFLTNLIDLFFLKSEETIIIFDLFTTHKVENLLNFFSWEHLNRGILRFWNIEIVFCIWFLFLISSYMKYIWDIYISPFKNWTLDHYENDGASINQKVWAPTNSSDGWSYLVAKLKKTRTVHKFGQNMSVFYFKIWVYL